MNSPASGSSSVIDVVRSETLVRMRVYAPVLPQTHRVIPSSGSGIADDDDFPFVNECLSFPFRFARPLEGLTVGEAARATPLSSTDCSRSSCLKRLFLELLAVDNGGLVGLLAVVSDGEVVESGDFEVLAEGPDRLPDLRVSLRDGGGPITAVCAIGDLRTRWLWMLKGRRNRRSRFKNRVVGLCDSIRPNNSILVLKQAAPKATG